MDSTVVPRPIISLEGHGDISPKVADWIVARVRACYNALDRPSPNLVTLSIFDTLDRWQNYAAERSAAFGVTTAGDEGFLTTHDAWEGIPRLSVCLERFEGHSLLIQQGALHQIVAHSILHGEPAFYRFMIPRNLVILSQARGVDMEILQQVLYFVAIAIKSYEVVRLLVKNEFIQDQIALAQYQLKKGEDDIVLWKMARWDPRARLLYLSGQLKPLLYLQPLLPFAPDLIDAGREMLSHLPPEEIERIEALTRTLTEQHSENTHMNVTRALASVLEELLGPPSRDTIRAG